MPDVDLDRSQSARQAKSVADDKQVEPNGDAWRHAFKIAAAWVALAGTVVFVLGVIIAKGDWYPIEYALSFVLLVFVLALPLAVGQWHQSWKVAWMALASEVVYAVVAMIILAVWYMFHF